MAGAGSSEDGDTVRSIKRSEISSQRFRTSKISVTSNAVSQMIIFQAEIIIRYTCGLTLRKYTLYVQIKCQLDATDDFYCRSYCLLNMFRTPLCPSSGAREYYTGGCCPWYLVLWFSSCRHGVELRVVCPVWGLLLLLQFLLTWRP